MRLYAGIRHGSEPSTEVSAEGDTYEAAREALDALLPPGWQMTGISQWPCGSPEAVAARGAALTAALERLGGGG